MSPMHVLVIGWNGRDLIVN